MKALTSKAPGELVRERAAGNPLTHGLEVESVGGVDAEKRVAAGEAVDIVVLATKAIARLAEAGHVDGSTRTTVLATETVAAVRAGAPVPALGAEDDLRTAIQDAGIIGVSTGPSGDAIRALVDEWQLDVEVVTAPPGVGVATLIAAGSVALGFQQRTELDDRDGVVVVGGLPGARAIRTQFVGAVTAAASDPEAARSALAVLAEQAAGTANATDFPQAPQTPPATPTR